MCTNGFGDHVDVGMVMMLWNPDKVFNSLHFQLLAEIPEEQTALQQLFEDNDLSQEFLQTLETYALLKNREEAVSKIYLWLDKQQRSGTIKRSIIEIWRHLLPLLEEGPDTATADMRAFESMDALLVPMPEPPPPSKATSPPASEGQKEAATNDGLDALRRTNVGDLIPASSNEVQAKIMSYLVYEPEPLTPHSTKRSDVEAAAEDVAPPPPQIPDSHADEPLPLVPESQENMTGFQEEHWSADALETKVSQVEPDDHVTAGQRPVGEPHADVDVDVEAPQSGFAVEDSQVTRVPKEALFEDDTPKTPEEFGEFDAGEASAIRDALVEEWNEEISAAGTARLVSQPQPPRSEQKQDKARKTNQEKAYRPAKRSIRDFLDDDDLPSQHPRAHEAPLSRQTNPLPIADTEASDFPLLSAPRGYQPYKPPTPRPETSIKPLPFIPTPLQARRVPEHNPEHPPVLHTKKRPGPHKRIYQTGNYPRVEQIGDTGNHPQIHGNQAQHEAPYREERYKPPSQSHPPEHAPRSAPLHSMQPHTSARYRAAQRETQYPRGEQGPPPTGQHPLHTLRQRRAQSNPRMYVDPPGPENNLPMAAGPMPPHNRPRKRAPAHTLAPTPANQPPGPRYSGTPLPNHGSRPQQTPLPGHLTRGQRPGPPAGGSVLSYTGSQNAFLQEVPRQVPKRPRVKAGLSPEEHRENSRGSLPRMAAVPHLASPEERRAARADDIYATDVMPDLSSVSNFSPGAPRDPMAATTPHDPIVPANGHHTDHPNRHDQDHEQSAFARTPSIELPAAGNSPQSHAQTEDIFGLHPSEPPTHQKTSSGIFEIPSDEFEKLDPQAELNQFLLTEAPTPSPMPAAEDETPSVEASSASGESHDISPHGAFDPERYASDEIELIFDEEVERISAESMSTSLAMKMGLTPPPASERELMEQLDNAPAFEGLDSDSFDELPMAEVGILPTLEFSSVTTPPAAEKLPTAEELIPAVEPTVAMKMPEPSAATKIPEPTVATKEPEPTAIDLEPLGASGTQSFSPPQPIFSAPRQPKTWLVVLLTAIIVSTLLVGGTYIGKRWLQPTASTQSKPERDPYPFQLAKIPVKQIFADGTVLVFVMQKRWRQHATIQQIALRLFAALDTTQNKTIRKVQMLSHKGKHIHWFQLATAKAPTGAAKKSSD